MYYEKKEYIFGIRLFFMVIFWLSLIKFFKKIKNKIDKIKKIG